jgi:tellurite resistance protein
MQAEDLAVVKGLVSVAWADGRVADEESQVIDGVLAAYAATPSEQREVRRYASSKRSLEDIELTELSSASRRVLLQHAVLLTFVDGEQHQKEKDLIEDLVTLLRIPPAEAERVIESATVRARSMLGALGSPG